MSSDLRKVTLNLFASDVEFFASRFGWGWSTELRRIMRREVKAYNKRDQIKEEIEDDS
jgi:hypothetical protein